MNYHQSKNCKHDDSIPMLHKVEDKFLDGGMNHPTKFDDISRLEDLNEVTIFVYSVGGSEIIVKGRNGNYNYRNSTIMLFLLEDGEKSHMYMLRIHRNHYVYQPRVKTILNNAVYIVVIITHSS